MPSFDGVIQPGGQGKVTLATDTSHYTGKIRKDAEVETNDPKKPKINLYLEANILPIFTGKPWDRLVVSTPLGRKASQTITLTNQLDKPVKIVEVGHNLGKSAEVKLETVQEGQVYLLTLATEGTKAGRLEGRIHLKLAGAPAKGTDIPAYIHVWVPKKRVVKPKTGAARSDKNKQ